MKRASDSLLGVPSQCFVQQKAGIGGRGNQNKQLQYMGNLAMKFSCCRLSRPSKLQCMNLVNHSKCH